MFDFGGFLSGVGSLVGGLSSAFGNPDADQEARRDAWDKWHAQMRFTKEQAGIARNFASRNEAFTRGSFQQSFKEAQRQFDRAMLLNRNQFSRSMQFARQMDNTRVRRLVQDARAAGIHPLAALGANLSSPMASPVPASPGGVPSSGGFGGPSPQGMVSTESPSTVGGFGDSIGSGLAAVGLALGDALTRSMIRKNDAETVATLANAQSRTIFQRSRAAATGGPAAAVVLASPGKGQPDALILEDPKRSMIQARDPGEYSVRVDKSGRRSTHFRSKMFGTIVIPGDLEHAQRLVNAGGEGLDFPTGLDVVAATIQNDLVNDLRSVSKAREALLRPSKGRSPNYGKRFGAGPPFRGGF